MHYATVNESINFECGCGSSELNYLSPPVTVESCGLRLELLACPPEQPECALFHGSTLVESLCRLAGNTVHRRCQNWDLH